MLNSLFAFSTPGITVDKFGLIYFVDGTMIRRVDQNGIISTLLGSNDLTSARPLSCDSVMDISQVRRHCLPKPFVHVCSSYHLSPTQPDDHSSWHTVQAFEWSSLGSGPAFSTQKKKLTQPKCPESLPLSIISV